MYGSEGAVMKRLNELADREADILANGNPLPRMHS